jgi:hypothetical protein
MTVRTLVATPNPDSPRRRYWLARFLVALNRSRGLGQ